MKKNVNKRLTSLGYASRRTYQKLTTVRPSILVLASIAIVFSIFLIGGGMFDILERPLLVVPISSSRVVFFYPYSLGQQTILDSLTVMMAYSSGAAGLFLAYQSTKHAYKPRQAFAMLMIGAICLLIAYIYVEMVIYWKFNPPTS